MDRQMVTNTNSDKSPVSTKDQAILEKAVPSVKDQVTDKPTGPPEKQQPTQEQSSQAELNRVRELIIGPDLVQQRLRGAEADRIRDIIFGEQMQEYDRRFTDLQLEMERVLTDLRQMQDNIREFEQAQIKRVETLERETRQTDAEIRREVDRLRSQEAVVQQLVTQLQKQEMLSQNLQENIADLRKAASQQEQDLRSLRTTVNDNRDQRERKLDLLKQEIRQADDSLMAELRRLTDRLDTQKTDRKALAGMLMEVATRLETGSSVTGLLEKLKSPKQE